MKTARVKNPVFAGKTQELPKERLFSDWLFMTLSGILLVTLFATYSNHFHNPFEFDDAHTIVNNAAIRDIGNIPHFFTDPTTFSSLPANQVYRPGVTTLNAIDYWIGGKTEPDPFYFHISIFASYILLGILLFLFLKKIADTVSYSHWNKYFALFGTGFYCLHTANAETINYIIARSDSFSTMMILLSFVIFQYKPEWRNKFIYLIPVLLGFFVKEPTIMTVPLMLVYVVLIEKKVSFTECFTENGFLKVRKAAVSLWLGFILTFGLYFVSRFMASDTLSTGGAPFLNYFLTQPFAIVHYVNNFFLPFNLTADSDWAAVTNLLDDRVLVGGAFVLGMIIFAFYTSSKENLRPIAFGIFWFLLALLPTSLVPLAEVINDHRTFFPYIGLVLAAAWTVRLFYLRFEENLNTAPLFRFSFFGFLGVVLFAHAYGTHHRNAVWSSAESLWQDVTIKSPNNSRGLMNYANALMAKGDYPHALEYFERSKKINPGYSYLYINMGILKGAMGNAAEAESDFNYALKLDRNNPEGYYYYSTWLISQERFNDANEQVLAGLRVSPGHFGLNQKKEELRTIAVNGSKQLYDAVALVKNQPTAANYLNLSLLYYQSGKFDSSIVAANEALKINPNLPEAWNNICSSENMLGNFDAAVIAGQNALKLNPGFQLAQNNLNSALGRKMVVDSALSVCLSKPNADNYLNLSLVFYNLGFYQKCIDAAKEALKYNANSSGAYNNICSGNNMLKRWDEAIAAGEKGVSIDPDNVLLKNNLQIARQGKAASQ